MKEFRIKAKAVFEGYINVDAPDKIVAMKRAKDLVRFAYIGEMPLTSDLKVDFPRSALIQHENVMINPGQINMDNIEKCYCPMVFLELMNALDQVINYAIPMNRLKQIADNVLYDCGAYYEDYVDVDEESNCDWYPHMSLAKTRKLVDFFWSIKMDEWNHEEDIIQEAVELRTSIYNE